MIRVYLINALRNILKNRMFAFINIVGLSVGLAAAIYVLHYASLELSYDLFHKDSDRIYRVATGRIRDGVEITKFASTYAGVAPALRHEYRQVESVTRIFRRFRGGIVSYGDVRHREENVIHGDSSFFNVFSFPVLAGNKTDLLKPGFAFIEERTAQKYFGETNPVGKRITFGSVNGVEDYEIAGIVRCPLQSSITFSFLFSYQSLGHVFGTEHYTNWDWVDFHTFLKLRPNADAAELQKSFPKLLKKYTGDRASRSRLELQALPDIYLNSKAEFETGATGSKTMISVLIALSLITMIIVWLNFVNISTAQVFTRAKEVGIRKVLGSSMKALIAHFMTQTAILHLIAIFMAIVILSLAFPALNQLVQRQLSFMELLSTDLLIYTGGFLAAGTLIAGLYPAWQMASFKPVEVLKGFMTTGKKGHALREFFVGSQAFISFTLIALIFIVVDQIKFLQQQNPGFNPDNVLVVRTPEVVMNNEAYYSSLESYKNKVGDFEGVINSATTVDPPGAAVDWISGARRVGADAESSLSIYRSVIDSDFISAMNLKIIAGENFRSTNSDHDVMINRAAATSFNFENPDDCIGMQLHVGRDTFTIRAVIENFYQTSAKEPYRATVYHFNLETPRFFMIRYSEESPPNIVSAAGRTFSQMFPESPFEYYFLRDYYNKQHDGDRRLADVIGVFCILAISVSSLGLIGLTLLRLTQKRKEIAIRKVVGSTAVSLFVSTVRNLLATTFVGCVIAIPTTWFLVDRWLATFHQHTTPGPEHFAVAMFLSLMISLLTVSGYVFRAIGANPISELRQE